MFDQANVVSHVHASVMDGDGMKCTATSETNTTEQRTGESTSKSPGTKRREDMFMDNCMGEIRESGKTLIESLKANEDMKMALLMSMQQTMQKMVDKMYVSTECDTRGYSTSIGNVSAMHDSVFASHRLLAMPFLLAHNSLYVLPFVLIEI